MLVLTWICDGVDVQEGELVFQNFKIAYLTGFVHLSVNISK